MTRFKYSVSGFLFSYLGYVIFYLIGFLRMGCASIVNCFKVGGESLRPFQSSRRIFRQDLCVMWRKVSSKSSCNNHETLLLDPTNWVVVCGLLRWEQKLKGFFRRTFCVTTLDDTDPSYSEKVFAGMVSPSPFKIFGQNRVPATTLAMASITPNCSRNAIIFFVCGVDRITYLALVLMCMVNILGFDVLVLDVLVLLGLIMKRKTAATRSRSSLSPSIKSIVITSSKPSHPDSSFRYRHLKTVPDHQRYLRHFGYYLRHYGYFSDTVTIS